MSAEVRQGDVLVEPGRAYMPKAQSTEHETPRDLFDALWEEFGPFDCDPAAAEGQYTAERIWDAGGEFHVEGTIPRHYRERVHIDGLTRSWVGRVFLNPPYGRGVEKWIAKAVAEVRNGNAERVVALVKATTDVKWWQDYVLTGTHCQVKWPSGYQQSFSVFGGKTIADKVRFIKGRLRFGGAAGPAPFPSAIVVWEHDG